MKESFKAGDSYCFCSVVPNKKIEILINDLARFYWVMHCWNFIYMPALFWIWLKKKPWLMIFFFPINLVNGPSPLPPFSMAVAGRSSPLIDMLWAGSVEGVQKRTFQKLYIKILKSFWIVLREALFPNYFSDRGVFFCFAEFIFLL